MTDETEPMNTGSPQPVPDPQKPHIEITFVENQVALTIRECSPFQLWGVARMLEQYAEDQWQANRYQQAAAEAAAAVANGPQDHKPKRRGN